MATLNKLIVICMMVVLANGVFAENVDTDVSKQVVEHQVAKIDVNKASYQQLIAIKGIGPAKAKAILDYIAQNGDLVSLDELLEIRGIGQALLAQLKLKLTL